MKHSPAAGFFDGIAGRYERSYALPANESRRRMASVGRELPPPPARVLDLGVGTGRELTALLDAGFTPTGLDVSPAMLARCARRTRPVALVEGDFWQPLAFADASFDAAVALHGTLAHPPDGEALARLGRELARVVRRGGTWVIEAPTPAWLDRLDTLPSANDTVVERTGADTFVCRDTVAGVAIAGQVLSAEGWRAALGKLWDTRVDPLGPFEWMVVARRG